MEYDACALGDISDGGKKVVSLGAERVLLLRKGNEVWAVDSKCPHMKLPLSTGKWDGKTLKCRFHGASYSVADGSRVKAPWLLPSIGDDRLAIHSVRVEGGRVHVEFRGGA